MAKAENTVKKFSQKNLCSVQHFRSLTCIYGEGQKQSPERAHMKGRFIMKKTISLMLALASISSMGVSAMAANDTGEPMVIAPAPSVVATAQRQFVVNGKAMQLDSYTTENGTLMVPVRALAEALGFKVIWNNGEVNINDGEMQCDLRIGEDMLENLVTENKNLTAEQKRDLVLCLITLKYTQSNSVCYVKDGQAIGVGAGQQSRIHCTRLAGNKADNWYLRQHPKTLGLQFLDHIRRPDRDNAIDIYTSDEYEDVLADGVWQNTFKVRPEVLTPEEKKAWIATQAGVTVGSDAFFPFGDNVERARKSGVTYIAEPGGSIRDDHVIATADKYGMVLAFTGARLFHH